jgi:hypothetical protein
MTYTSCPLTPVWRIPDEWLGIDTPLTDELLEMCYDRWQPPLVIRCPEHREQASRDVPDQPVQSHPS